MRTTKMLGVSIIALTISTPVWGQEHASGNDQNAPAAGVSGANGSSASSGQIEDIVVTAQRRSENLQRVPVSVTAVTAEAVQALGVRGTQDLAVITPGLKVTISVGKPRHSFAASAHNQLVRGRNLASPLMSMASISRLKQAPCSHSTI